MASSQAEIQEKISAARREADGLKDKIRAAKDQTADTSCKVVYKRRLTVSARNGQRYTSPTSPCTQSPTYIERPLGQDICAPVVDRQTSLGVSFPGWKAHCVGRVHDKQGARHSAEVIMGHDLCVFALRITRRLWWSGQHLHNLLATWGDRPAGRTSSACSRTERTHWIHFVLSIPQRPTDHHVVG